MDYLDAQKKLLNHANLPGEHTKKYSEYESFGYVLWDCDRNEVENNIELLSKDIIDCLIIANIEYNGDVPSDRIGSGRKNEKVLYELSYPVSLILTRGLKYYRKWNKEKKFTEIFLENLLNNIYLISYAWDSVLAGDIDDLIEGTFID